MDNLTIYIGWDSREVEAFEVCEYTLRKHWKGDPAKLKIKALKQQELRENRLYYRAVDKNAATEFSLTRFLVPALSKFQGFAIFMDCDFVLLDDIRLVFDEIDQKHAVSVVKHDYSPTEASKMDGAIQHLYPRKNWSSFMVFNCAHPSNQRLSIPSVNTESPAFLHRFQWLDDEEIGEIGRRWNYLEGWYPADETDIKAIHFTRGGPWFQHMQDVDFADIWRTEYSSIKKKIA